MRKTKIVCTLGPATDNEEVLKDLMLAGMNVARINFSHGNYKDQEERINLFKRVRNNLKLPIPLLLDTQGPEIRIGKFIDGKIILEPGDTFTLSNKEIDGDKSKVSITYKNLYKEIKDIFDGCIVMKNDPSYIQGIPDLLVLYKNRWASLEVKKNARASRRPNQEYYVERMNNMSFSRFVCPENKDEVMHDLHLYFTQ